MYEKSVKKHKSFSVSKICANVKYLYVCMKTTPFGINIKTIEHVKTERFMKNYDFSKHKKLVQIDTPRFWQKILL